MNKRAAIYARVSTGKQEREGTSLESQVAESRAYAEQHGYMVVEIVQEQYSASRDIRERPKLQQLLTLARERRFDVLVVHQSDRLARDPEGDDMGWIKTELRWAGARIEFVKGLPGVVGRAIDTIKSGMERDANSERIVRARRATALAGGYIAGRAPYGYRHRREMRGTVLKIIGLDEDPVTSFVAREIFDTLARGGTAWGIANDLNRRGVPAPRGQRWRHSTILAIVDNPTYKGQPQALRYRIPSDELTRRRRVKSRPVEEWVALPSSIAPALVTPEVWQRANDQLRSNRTGARRRNPEPEHYLLRAGFVRCGYCGGAMCSLKVGGTPTYVCKQRAQAGCPESGSMRAEQLDLIVWNTVTDILKDPAWIRQKLEEQADDSTLADRVASARAGVKKMRLEEMRLAERLGELDDPTPVVARMNELAAARKAAEQELDDLMFQQQYAEQIGRRLKTFDRRFLDAYERVDAMGYDERRATLRQFAVQVTLWKRDHEPRFAIDWAFDLGDLDSWQTGEGEEEEEPWVIYTQDNMSPAKADLLVNSSA